MRSRIGRLAGAAFSIAAGLALGACAGTQVRAVATSSGQPAFDLRGTDLPTLAAEAARLCPTGHAVMRQWQARGQLAGVNADSVSANEIAWFVSYDVARPQAQMSIVCQA